MHVLEGQRGFLHHHRGTPLCVIAKIIPARTIPTQSPFSIGRESAEHHRKQRIDKAPAPAPKFWADIRTCLAALRAGSTIRHASSAHSSRAIMAALQPWNRSRRMFVDRGGRSVSGAMPLLMQISPSSSKAGNRRRTRWRCPPGGSPLVVPGGVSRFRRPERCRLARGHRPGVRPRR